MKRGPKKGAKRRMGASLGMAPHMINLTIVARAENLAELGTKLAAMQTLTLGLAPGDERKLTVTEAPPA